MQALGEHWSQETWFWSRSRAELWHKGETSGNTQHVVDVVLDCDGDALVVRVEPAGPACHTGQTSCFHNVIQDAGESRHSAGDLGEVINALYALVETRKRERPQDSYTTYLFDQGLDKILKKVGEESSETIIAAKNDDRGALTRESCDLLYHLIVLLVERGVALADLRDEFIRRGETEASPKRARRFKTARTSRRHRALRTNNRRGRRGAARERVSSNCERLNVSLIIPVRSPSLGAFAAQGRKGRTSQPHYDHDNRDCPGL
jgi:phosphoribosyl-ATP pyrophosphohydrolase/phosphoribosyl-AMP cyclohydrolase